jgi:alkylation response protein AidB-like acyl-CoA dehydrogenase
MATGQVLGCFGLTEPDHGSNPADLQASAVQQPGGGYLLNGTKDLHHQRHHRRPDAVHGAHRRARGPWRQRLPGTSTNTPPGSTCDARVTTLYEGTSQIQQLIIGRALTGISAF